MVTDNASDIVKEMKQSVISNSQNQHNNVKLIETIIAQQDMPKKESLISSLRAENDCYCKKLPNKNLQS